MGTCRRIAALRPQPGRDYPLIQFYQSDKRKAQYAEKYFQTILNKLVEFPDGAVYFF